jgi:hypothetical protein
MGTDGAKLLCFILCCYEEIFLQDTILTIVFNAVEVFDLNETGLFSNHLFVFIILTSEFEAFISIEDNRWKIIAKR